MEKGDKKLINFGPKGVSKHLTSVREDFKPTCKAENRWYKELVSTLIQKAESIQKAREQIMKLIETKNVLVSKLKAKDDEIHRLNGKVSLLLSELSTLKTNQLKSLEEIKMLKNNIHESAKKNEIMEQQKLLHDKMQKGLVKSQQLLTKEKLKTQYLESVKLNPHRWRTMQYTDPHYFEVLQKKNYLQKELMKKIHLMQGKDAVLEQKNVLLKNLQNLLKRRPYNLMKDPNKQMMEFYKTIQLQKEKIKILTAQVNMFESVLSDRYHKLR